MRSLLAALAVISSIQIIHSPLFAQEAPRDKLDSLLLGIETLSASVTQLIVESDGAVLEESSIQMHLLRPDGFYWETLVPFPELVVTNGKTLWNYQPDLEQVVVEDWDNSRSELAAQLLSGRTDRLSEEYRIELATDADDNQSLFRLHPLDADSVYRLIRISFLQQELESIHLDSKNGQQTLWQFSDLQRNQGLDSSLFEFEPPAGIEIVDNSSSGR